MKRCVRKESPDYAHSGVSGKLASFSWLRAKPVGYRSPLCALGGSEQTGRAIRYAVECTAAARRNFLAMQIEHDERNRKGLLRGQDFSVHDANCAEACKGRFCFAHNGEDRCYPGGYVFTLIARRSLAYHVLAPAEEVVTKFHQAAIPNVSPQITLMRYWSIIKPKNQSRTAKRERKSRPAFLKLSVTLAK